MDILLGMMLELTPEYAVTGPEDRQEAPPDRPGARGKRKRDCWFSSNSSCFFMNHLSDKKFRSLISAYREGDKLALNEIKEASRHLIKKIASHYEGDRNELCDVGGRGLVVAVEKFDLSKRYKFLTYSTWWIRAEIHKFLKLPLD